MKAKHIIITGVGLAAIAYGLTPTLESRHAETIRKISLFAALGGILMTSIGVSEIIFESHSVENKKTA